MQDANWNVVALYEQMPGTPSLAGRFAYGAYGLPLSLDASYAAQDPATWDWQVLHAGQFITPESQLYECRVRTYHFLLGRYLQIDPWPPVLSPPRSYEYAYSNPMSYFDPLGLFPARCTVKPKDVNPLVMMIWDLPDLTGPAATELLTTLLAKLNFSVVVLDTTETIECKKLKKASDKEQLTCECCRLGTRDPVVILVGVEKESHMGITAEVAVSSVGPVVHLQTCVEEANVKNSSCANDEKSVAVKYSLSLSGTASVIENKFRDELKREETINLNRRTSYGDEIVYSCTDCEKK
jgi:RHS repeat-associated protein